MHLMFACNLAKKIYLCHDRLIKMRLLAMLFIAWATFSGFSFARESIAETQAKAEQGDAEAQLALGFRYYFADGVPRDAHKGVKLFRDAAVQGHTVAQLRLGECYEHGDGVTKDLEEAVKWYRKAAELGDAQAQDVLGDCYAKGKGVSQDEVEAVKWYRKGAEQGFAPAQRSLGISYERGEGVPINGVEALKWFYLARRLDSVAVLITELEKVLTPEQIAMAQKLWEEWRPKSTQQQYALEQYNLAVRYAEGKGMPKDAVEACKWFHLSSAQGNEEAAKYRALVEKTMTPEQIAEAQKLAKEWKPTPPK